MNTYYVDMAVGDDTNLGTSEGAGNAWKTIDKAMNTVAADDKVWVKASADYTETATMDTTGWIIFEGYTSTPGDGGKATIDGGSSRANGITSALNTTKYLFKNFIIENHTSHGYNSTTTDGMIFENCEFNTNGARGCETDNGSVFLNCIATANTTDGFGSDVGCIYVNCQAFNNTLDGFKSDAGGIVCYNCVAASNGADNFLAEGSAVFGPATILNCTIDGDGKDSDSGIRSVAGQEIKLYVNNIIYDCVVGIDNGIDVSANRIGLNNLLNSNTTDYDNWGAPETDNDVTGAPAFTDETSQDYTLGSGSAAINAGADFSGSSSPGMDIGAHQSADAGNGGGGLLVHPGTAGGARG